MYGLHKNRKKSASKTASKKKGSSATKKRSTGGKMSKAQLGAMGKKITARAKEIRKKSPGMKWQTAMSKAGKEFKSK